MTDERDVARALLGSWPNQVASWGREALAAYLAELAARGVSPDAALVAIRSCPAGQKFPPSAPELAALARQDPERPTFDEAFQGIYGPGGVFGVKRSGVTVSPWVTAFVDWFGRDRLRMLEVDCEVEGKWRRRELRESYEQFLEVAEGRVVAQIARSGRGTLGRVDPLTAVGGGRLGIGQTTTNGEET
jgi:hypothetical protein